MVIKGIIRPPPEIRAVADRTASYVAKNGRAFEARILNSEKGKAPKFAFLQPTSPFHAYYEDKITFYTNGGDDEEEEKKIEESKKAAEAASNESKTTNGAAAKEAVRKKEKMQKASAIDPIAKALLSQRSKISQAKAKQQAEQEKAGAGGTDDAPQPLGPPKTVSIPPPPPLDLVTIVAPDNLSPTEIETIQLVAQFSAMDGKGGAFLHQLTSREWNNPAFSFCQPRHAHFAYFSALVDGYRRILGSWIAAAASAKGQDKDAKPPKASLQDALQAAAYRAEYNREMILLQESQQEEGEVMAIDWHDFVVVETIDFPVDEKVELSMLPPPPPSTAGLNANPSTTDAMEESDEEEETIRVVLSYTPKVVGTANPQAARAIDPITGKSVSVADMPEHMRIQLLDPKWAEERKKFQDKQKDSNLVEGDDIVSNLSRFSQAKGDLFGKSEQELLDKEKDSKRRLEEANRIIREQANLPGPALPSTTPATSGLPPSLPGAGSTEPAAKRMRVDDNAYIPPPPPAPPAHQSSVTTTLTAPPPPPPAPTGMELSGNPMADAMLLNNMTQSNESSGAVKSLLSEAEFVSSLSKPEVTLQIRIPNDPSQMAWNFYGQILSLTVNVMAKIKDVKADLSRTHLNGMPVNKIQFRDPNSGFLNNAQSLAALNIGPTATLELVPKTRGGRR